MNHSNQMKTSSVVKKSPSGLKRPIPVNPLELTELEDVNIDGEGLALKDPNYQSELEYDGYQNIEEYDNHAYNLDVDRKDNPEKELNFDDANDPPGNHE